ncbi:hypothetical protein C2X80_000001, partial [Escherichia coli]|nr:hypothetical protein [Escherichia coli]
YNEVPHARKILSYISNESDIPNERKEKLIRIILSCRIGNGVSYNAGVSPLGKPIYDSILNMLGDDNIVQVIIAFYNQEIYHLLSNQNCRKHAVQILTDIRTNVVSDKLKQILDYLIVNGDTLEKTMKTTEFKALASSHIKFS